ncbi:leishmanolysin-like peptidase isoform X2 [Oscarella lobularis]
MSSTLPLLVLVSSLAHTIYVPQRHELSHVPLDPPHVIRKRSFDQSLRISVFYDSTINALDSAKKTLVQQQLLPNARDYWSNILSVKQTTTPILLNRDCVTNGVYFVANQPRHCERMLSRTGCASVTQCGTVQVQADHLQACYSCLRGKRSCEQESGSVAGAGVANSDYVLYVSSNQTAECGSGSFSDSNAAENVAYAGHCQQDLATDRPVFGFINICPNLLSTSVDMYGQQLAIIKHEILHALGFSVSLYAFYRDSNGNPRTARDSNNYPMSYNQNGPYYVWDNTTIATVTRNNWQTRSGVISHNVNIVVTPKVKEVARTHFNCPLLDGVELENQGSAQTAFSHWEKRLLENEAMTGTFTQNPVFSEITFALLEDSGWYKPDYSKADRLNWGKNAGCSFTTQSCGSPINSNNPAPFCTALKQQPFQLRCTVDRLAVALCNMVKYTADLDSEYQYFTSIEDVSSELGSYGGSVQLADYCPYDQEFTWTSSGQVIRGSRCRPSDNSPTSSSNYGLETYGSQSMCIEQGEAWKRSRMVGSREETVTAINWGSGCYKVKCHSSSRSYDVIFAQCTYSCQNEGDRINVNQVDGEWTYTGSLICASYESVCWDAELQNTVANSECPDQPGDGGGGAEKSSVCLPALTVIFLLRYLF